MNDQNARLNVHDHVVGRAALVEGKPVQIECKPRVGVRKKIILASVQYPPNHGPTRENIRRNHLIGRMNASKNVPNHVRLQHLTFGRGKVLLVEPILIVFGLAKADVVQEKFQLFLHFMRYSQLDVHKWSANLEQR